jgi:hypothetical protein
VSYALRAVYKGFDDLGDFEREVGELQKTTPRKPAERPAGRPRGVSEKVVHESVAITAV